MGVLIIFFLFSLQSSWIKPVNQNWTNSLARYGDVTPEPPFAANGSLKPPANAGQRLLLQALVYNAVTVGVFSV